MNKNKDLPASPLMPMQDKFGQVIVMSGYTKHEAAALEIFKHLLTGIDPDDTEDVKYIVKQAYEIAEIFTEYYDKLNQQNDAILMPV